MAIRYRNAEERDRGMRARAKERVTEVGLAADHPAVLHAQRLLGVCRTPDTADNYSFGLVHYFRWCVASGTDPLTQSELDAEAFMAYQNARSYAPATVGSHLCAIKAFFRTAVREKLIAANPFGPIRMPDNEPVTPTPSITYEQADRLAQVCHEAAADPSLIRQRNGAFAYLLMRTGPRAAETANGLWGHLVERPEGLSWQIKGKGTKWAPLLLPPDVAEVLARWRRALEQAIDRPLGPEDALVPRIVTPRNLALRAKDGPLEGVSTTVISEGFKNLLAEIGVEGPRYAAHSGRATAATLGYGATKDVLAVQRMLRHKSGQMTQRYIRGLVTPSPAAAWLPRPLAADGSEAA